MKVRREVFLFYLWAVFTAGCAVLPAQSAGREAEAAPEGKSQADCPITLPPGERFVPPKPWPEHPPEPGEFWFGEPGLWTALPNDGSWAQLALGEKFWFWSEAYLLSEDYTPDITLTATLLEGKAPVFQTTEATNGYHPSFGQAMLTGVTLGAPGCWEFQVEFKEFEISFVVWVPDSD